ncbi:MAG: toll/interleukin-1 receptor domain-containing protein [Nodosilinea sp.]
MADVFISYSRQDKDFVQVLHQALTESRYDTWVDWEDIPPTADWWAEIEAGIEAADAFVFVISPDSVVSKVCNREIDHAVAKHKRIVPIVRRDGFGSADINRALSKHNWLYFRPEDGFEAAFAELVKALNTDLEHVKTHTWLLVRSQEWLHKNQNLDLLLRGSQLEDIVTWITKSADKAPHLTPEQRQYVATSTKAERDQQAAEIQHQQKELRRQRIWLGLTGAAFLVASGLGVLAFSQFQIAEARRKAVEYSQIETLATSATAFLEKNQGLDGLLYGLQAARKLEQMEDVPLKTKLQVTAALQQALHETPDRNRLVGHSDEVWYATLSPDGQLIASSGIDNTAKLWNLDGKALALFKGHTDPVSWVAISADNQLIATASEDNTIKLWNQSGTLLKTLTAHTDGVRSVTFTPNGKQLVSAGRDGTVKFWDLNGHVLKTLEAHARACNATFSPDGNLLLTFSCTNEIKLWSPSGELLKTFPENTGDTIRVAFSPDGQRIATSTWGGDITLWSVTGQMLKSIKKAHKQAIWGLDFSADGQTLYSASEDGSFQFRTTQGEVIATGEDLVPAVGSIDVSADGELLILGDNGGAVRIWELNQQSSKHSDIVWDLSFSPDGQTFVTKSLDQTAKLWTADGTLIKTFGGYSFPVNWVSFSTDGESLILATADGTVRDLILNGQEIKTWPTPYLSSFTHTSISPNGTTVARADTTGFVEIRSKSGQKIASFQAHDAPLEVLSFSSDGTKLATIPWDPQDYSVKIWSFEGKLLNTLKGHQNQVVRLAFSPDKKFMVSSSFDRTIKLWDMNGKELRTFQGHRAAIFAVAFSPDSQLLASGGEDNEIKLWTLDGQELATLQGHENSITSLAFNPQGNVLASADEKGRILLWNLEVENLLVQSCHGN